MSNITCKKCGADHIVKKVRIPYKGTDEEWCKKCGEKLISWTKSTTIYEASLRESNK